jgi:hypothetical protein
MHPDVAVVLPQIAGVTAESARRRLTDVALQTGSIAQTSWENRQAGRRELKRGI